MAKVRIWTARLHDPDEIRGLEARVENELALHPAHLVQVDWLTAAAGGDAVCDINLIAIVTTGVPRS